MVNPIKFKCTWTHFGTKTTADEKQKVAIGIAIYRKGQHIISNCAEDAEPTL